MSCYCGRAATLTVPGWRCTRHICHGCRQREQDGPQLHAKRLEAANRHTQEELAAKSRCVDCNTWEGTYIRRANGEPTPAVCGRCRSLPPPNSGSARLDRQIAAQRALRAEMRAR
jgi:hypothetical protein